MNILFVDQFSELGGAQQCLLDLMPGIAQRGWQAHVAAPGAGPLVTRLRDIGIPFDETHSMGHQSAAEICGLAWAYPANVVGLRGLVVRKAIDLVFVNGPRMLPVAACLGRPVVFHAHSVPGPSSARTIARLALRSAEAEVIAVSNFVAASWLHSVPNERLRVIYNGVADFGVREIRPSGPLRVGIIGRIAPEKGHLDFVRAAHIVNRTRDDVRFVVCGAPLFSGVAYASRVRAEARGASVQFVGWHDEVASVLHSLDLLAVPSAPNDAAPRVILEALSAGVPVVAYRSGGIPELIASGGGVLTPEPTPEALAREILDLIADPERMRILSIAGRQSWSQRFRVERYREEILALLDRHETKSLDFMLMT